MKWVRRGRPDRPLFTGGRDDGEQVVTSAHGGKTRPRACFLALACLSLSLFFAPAGFADGPGDDVAGPAADVAAPDRAAAPPRPLPADDTFDAGPADFDTCARVALRQSPYLTKSSVEIDNSRLDETDSRFGMTPNVMFRTYYYVTKPDIGGRSSKPYFIQFNTEEYNPVGAYFTLQARKIFTQVAVLSHMKVISEGLFKLGKSFLDLAALKEIAELQEEYITLAQKNLQYVRQRSGLGDANNLELQLALQEVKLAEAEKANSLAKQRKLTEGIRTFLGVPKSGPFALQLHKTREQVMRSFNPATASGEEASTRSFEVRIQGLKRELQSWHVALAKSKLLPNFIMSVQTPDPLSTVNNGGLYFYVGLSLPVWDGFTRLRNVSRQKNVLRQVSSECNLKEADTLDKWQEAQDRRLGTVTALKLAQTHLDLARMKERQADIRYHSGGEPLTSLVQAQKDRVEAQKAVIAKTLENDLAALEIRYLSGDLVYTYVDEKSWQK